MRPVTSTISLGWGSLMVEKPPPQLLEALRMFSRSGKGGAGAYEDLFFMSQSGDILTTMPGFADRVVKAVPHHEVVDLRKPMPSPDIEAATSGLDPVWHSVVKAALSGSGGIVYVPDALGGAGMAAAIIRAFPRDDLTMRGTPLCVVLAKDRDEAGRITAELRRALPGRDVGRVCPGSYTDSEDVMVMPPQSLVDVQTQYVGILIDASMEGVDLLSRAESISRVRSAARWRVVSTPVGGSRPVDMPMEGLFGPVVASAEYNDAVKAGLCAPITVCWLPAPRPQTYLGSADSKTLAAVAMQNNPDFVSLVSDIIRRVPADTGCLCCAEPAMASRVIAEVPGLVGVTGKVPAKERSRILGEISNGTIRKAVIAHADPFSPDHGVMVVATCGGRDAAGWRIPWRHLKKPGDKTYIMDFRHEWDVHNGRPGRLGLNDEARTLRYKELGFNQMLLGDVAQLPFG